MLQKRSGQEKRCVFPFRLKNSPEPEIRCTGKSDPDGRRWCSTKVNETGFHVPDSGFWGYCDEPCLERQEIDGLLDELEAQIETRRNVNAAKFDCPCVSLLRCPSLSRLAHFAKVWLIPTGEGRESIAN